MSFTAGTENITGNVPLTKNSTFPMLGIAFTLLGCFIIAALVICQCHYATMVTPNKEATSPRCGWTAASSCKQQKQSFELPSPKPQELLPINVLTEISFTLASKLISL